MLESITSLELLTIDYEVQIRLNGVAQQTLQLHKSFLRLLGKFGKLRLFGNTDKTLFS